MICDLAEVYGIYRFQDFSPLYISILVSGLGEESRTKKAITGQKADMKTMLLAGCLDALNLILWSKTKDAEHGKNRPKSMVDALMHGDVEKKPEKSEGFSNPDDMLKERERILNEIKRGDSK